MSEENEMRKIDFLKMVRKQRVIDALIFEKAGVVSYDEIKGLHKRALLDEIGEFSTALKLAKYWTTKKPNRAEVLAEYVDVWHFLNSYPHIKGIPHKVLCSYSIEMNEEKQPLFFNLQTIVEKELINKHVEIFVDYVNVIYRNIKREYVDFSDYQNALKEWAKVGTMIGFSASEVENAYFKKAKENVERTQNGY